MFDELSSWSVVELSSPTRAHAPVLAVPLALNVTLPFTVTVPDPLPGLVMVAPAGVAKDSAARPAVRPTVAAPANNLRTNGILFFMILLGKAAGG